MIYFSTLFLVDEIDGRFLNASLHGYLQMAQGTTIYIYILFSYIIIHRTPNIGRRHESIFFFSYVVQLGVIFLCNGSRNSSIVNEC